MGGKGFIAKLPLLRRDLASKKFITAFPRLSDLEECPNDDTLLLFLDHLSQIKEDMKKKRFKDRKNGHSYLSFEHSWCIRNWWSLPQFFRSGSKPNWSALWLRTKANFQNTCRCVPRFLTECNYPSLRYPVLWKKVKLLLISFLTLSSWKGALFSVVAQILIKSVNRLNIVERGNLQLRLT